MVNNPPGWQTFTGSQPMYGLVTQPAAGQVIVDSGALPAGVYRVDVTTSYGGVADVIDNMALFNRDAKVMTLPVIPVANASPVQFTITAFVVYEGQHLTVRAIAAAGAGAVYRATISCTPVQSQDPS